MTDDRMPTSTFSSRAAARLLRIRWIARAPIWLYRAHLGFVFGHRLLLLEHTGRTSGARRYVVIEVIGSSPSGYVVASGFGEQAQWLRNVTAHPEVRISIGTRVRVPARATRLSPAERAQVLGHYIRKHPKAWRRLGPMLSETLGEPVDATGANLPMVRFELT